MKPVGRRISAWIGVAAISLTTSCAKVQGSSKGQEEVPPMGTIFLLHGMGRTRASMLILSRRFKGAGYRTVNLRYSQCQLRFKSA